RHLSRSTLFPYTTLFRSQHCSSDGRLSRVYTLNNVPKVEVSLPKVGGPSTILKSWPWIMMKIVTFFYLIFLEISMIQPWRTILIYGARFKLRESKSG